MSADPGGIKRGGRAPGQRDAAPAIVVGVDTGGTFTDLVALVGGAIRVHKVLSTPDDPARAVVEGLRAMLTGDTARVVTYSSTVATNALLEKKGARVALFTNAGFEFDRDRPPEPDRSLRAGSDRPEPLVARAMRFGVAQRTLFDGSEARRLTRAELARIARIAARSGARPSRSDSCTATRIRAPRTRSRANWHRLDVRSRCRIGFSPSIGNTNASRPRSSTPTSAPGW